MVWQTVAAHCIDTVEDASTNKYRRENRVHRFLTWGSYFSQRDAFTIVPILVGALKPRGEKQFGQLLSKYLLDSSNLFVISSDFCHWGLWTLCLCYGYVWSYITYGVLQGNDFDTRTMINLMDKSINALRQWIEKWAADMHCCHVTELLRWTLILGYGYSRVSEPHSILRISTRVLKHNMWSTSYCSVTQCENLLYFFKIWWLSGAFCAGRFLYQSWWWWPWMAAKFCELFSVKPVQGYER